MAPAHKWHHINTEVKTVWFDAHAIYLYLLCYVLDVSSDFPLSEKAFFHVCSRHRLLFLSLNIYLVPLWQSQVLLGAAPVISLKGE